MDLIFFIIGTLFGSFFTLAVYRIPLGKDITHERSYCPNCNHKLGVLDLIPILSYLLLRGKCRYCKQKIRIRYLVLELATGLIFMLYAMSFQIDWANIVTVKIIILILGLLYFTCLLIIAGIDKDKKQIQKSVLIYGLIIDMIYILYIWVFEKVNVYGYIIYLVLMATIILADILVIKKKLETSYTLQVLALLMVMVLFSGEVITYFTVLFALVWISFVSFKEQIKKKKNKVVKREEKRKLPIGYYLAITNIILIIINNFLIYS